MRAEVDRDLCIGCGLCEEECPDVFVLREDGYAYVIAEDITPELYDLVRGAADVCPVEAISIRQ